MAVRNISDPTVHVRDADGLTAEGARSDLVACVADDSLSPGDVSSTRPLAFFNPERLPFDFDLAFYGLLNQSPAFTSLPDEEALLGRSTSMTPLRPIRTAIRWRSRCFRRLPERRSTPSPDKSHLFRRPPISARTPSDILVDDGRGGTAEQTYALGVDTDVPNRPPVFTATPIVDGNVNASYRYDVNALDDDGDTLTFALVAGPSGMSIDPATGEIIWTPDRGSTRD